MANVFTHQDADGPIIQRRRRLIIFYHSFVHAEISVQCLKTAIPQVLGLGVLASLSIHTGQHKLQNKFYPTQTETPLHYIMR